MADKYRVLKREGKESIDAIAEIIDGESSDGPRTSLVDLVNAFHVRPQVRVAKEIEVWLKQISEHVNAYRSYMNKKLGG